MDIVVALIGLTMTVIVAAYVAQPLIARLRTGTATLLEDSPRDKLMAERDALYAAIRDLDFDFQTGKLLEADYRAMREKYAARGVEILKGLDAMPEIGWRRAEGGSRKAEIADDIEAAVRARRKAKPAQSAPIEDEIEAAIRARRQAAHPSPKSEIGNQNCPNCGRPVDSTDRFCAKCGASLAAEATR
jgi:hypothetical protein